jgi:hypothetical protein
MMAIIAIGFMFVAAMLEGWALSMMWGWFIVPVFHAPSLRIPYAIGLALVVGMLTHRVRKEEDTPDLPTFIIHGLVMPFAFIATGWIVKLFI